MLVKSNPHGVVVDGTYGRGGHTRGMLGALSPRGQLHAFDMDGEAIENAKALASEDQRFRIHHSPFSAMGRVLEPLVTSSVQGVGGVSGVLFDLGISSPQFDEAHRGFRPEADGPLDLRFDQSRGETAHQFLMRAERSELIRILSQFGETTDAVAARRIADAICVARDDGSLPERTKEFAALIARAKGFEYQAMHPAKLTFQALRIHLNDEFGECRRGLEAAFELLEPGGRIGVITWKHSECSLVVDFCRAHEAVSDQSPQMQYYRTRVQETLDAEWAVQMEHTIRPSAEELQKNSRSRSAVLHILKKVRAPTMAQLEAKLYPLMRWESPSTLNSGNAVNGGEKTSCGGLNKECKARKKPLKGAISKEKHKKDKKDKKKTKKGKTGVN
eukprot:scaffold62927_cov32-Tisochrysis_lutea.AAC.2